MIDLDNLRVRLIAAVPAPFDAAGELHRPGLHDLISSLAGRPFCGFAVDTLLSRGLRFSPDQRADLLSSWREGLGESGLLVALAGAQPDLRRPPDVFRSALAMAQQAAQRGADILLVEPPGSVRGRPDRDRLVLEYHSEIAQAGLPMLVAYRREMAGGIGYGPDVLAQLLARSEVLGVEIATIDSIATFQQVEALARELAPAKLVISGEERFLGYSLMSGADTAIVGMASAYPDQVLDLRDAQTTGDAARFMRRSVEVDRLARRIFAPPMDRAMTRLLSTLVQSGTLPIEAAYDPWGPRPDRAQIDRSGGSPTP